MTDMYRSEQWFNELNGKKLQTPLCILSYQRPNAPIFGKKSKLMEYLDPTWAHVFVREDDYNSYEYLKDKVSLEILPEWVCEAGTTREAILQWALQNNHENIFMFDDRVYDVRTLSPRYTKNGKQIMGAMSNSNPYVSLLIWEYLQQIYPTTISMPSIEGYNWYPENINREFKINNPGGGYVCFQVNVKDCQKHNIHYGNTKEYGIDDTQFLYQILKAGLPSRIFTDLEFREVYPEKITGISGSNATTGLSRKERLVQMKTVFCEKVLGIKPFQKNLEFSFRKNDREGFLMTFNYAKHWSKYYEEHKAK